MKKTSMSPAEKARDCLESLLPNLPESSKELKKRMRGVTVAALAEAMGERMRERYDSREFVPYYAIVSMLRAPEVDGMLAGVASDREVPIPARAAALMMIADASPLMVLLGDDAPAVLRAGFKEFLIAGVLHGATGLIVELLVGTAAERTFVGIEAARRELGVPAAAVYREALRHPGLVSLHAQIIDAIVADRLHGTAEILEVLAASGGPAESLLKRAAMKARSSAEPAEMRPHQAYVGPAAPEAAFLGVRMANPDGSEFVVVMRDPYGGGIEAMVDYTTEPEEFDLRFDQLLMVPADLLPVAQRLAPAAVPEDLWAAALLVASAGAPPEEAPLPVAEGVDKRKLKRLITKDEYGGWVLSADILTEALVPSPQSRRPNARWIEGALWRIESHDAEYPKRVAAAAWQMARWHEGQGQLREASLLAAAASQVASDFTTSALGELLMRGAVELEYDAMESSEPTPPRGLGDETFPEVRLMIRETILEPGSRFHEMIDEFQKTGYSREEAVEAVIDFVFEQAILMGGGE